MLKHPSPPPPPASQLEALTAHRLETLTTFMAASDLDALVLTMFDNVRWATNWRAPDFAEARDAGFAAIVTRDGACSFFSSYLEQRAVDRDDASPSRDGLGQDTADGVAPHVVERVPLPAIYPRTVMAETLGDALGGKLHELGATSAGVDELPFAAHQRVAARVPGCRVDAIALDLQAARAVKHPVEIDLMRAGAASLDRATAAAMSALAAGETVDEARGRAGQEIYRLGAESISHMLIDAGEANGSGTTARIDVGFYGLEGYAADMARTTCVGTPSADLADGFARIHETYLRCLDELRPGRLASEFDRAARDVVAGLGHGDFWLVLGHGIGLRVCEHPNFTPAEMLVRDAVLEPGMVISVELHLDHRGHPISLEDMLLLTQTGAEPLTHAPHDFGAWA